MRVIKKGNVGKKRAKCYHCGSLIEYEDSEIHEGRSYDHVLHLDVWTKYFFCPVCKYKLVVGEMAFEE